MLGKETQKSHERRTESGFYDKYMSGNGIDVGFCGYNHAAKIQPVLPTAIGVELDFFKKDGQIFRWKEGQYKDTKVLPWPDNSLDYVFSSHVLEHIDDYKSALQDWHRVLKVGGHIVCVVPHKFLYEKKEDLPSLWNSDHKRFYTPASLLAEVEESLAPNSYRVVHLKDNDEGMNYQIPPEKHSVGCHEIELVLKKIKLPYWEIK